MCIKGTTLSKNELLPSNTYLFIEAKTRSSTKAYVSLFGPFEMQKHSPYTVRETFRNLSIKELVTIGLDLTQFKQLKPPHATYGVYGPVLCLWEHRWVSVPFMRATVELLYRWKGDAQRQTERKVTAVNKAI